MYEARGKELLETLEKTNADPNTKSTIQRAIETYLQQREVRLRGCLDLLKPGNTRPCLESWLHETSDAREKAFDAFKDLEGFGFAAAQENMFFFRLHESSVPKQRDKMVLQAENLKKAMVEFENKWSAIKSADDTIDDQMVRIAEEYEKILNSAAHLAATFEKETKEKVADQIKLILKVVMAPVDWGWLENAINAAASALGVKLNETQARKLEIHALLSREETVYATFKEARDIVKEFLEENGVLMIKDAWEDAEDAAEQLEGEMETDGQKRDAAEFANAVKDVLKNVFAATNDTYKEFALKHQYLFFGPLGAGYYQELCEDDRWKEFEPRWKEYKEDFDDLLRERHLTIDSDQLLEISLAGLSDDEKDRIHSRLQGAFQDLLRRWNAFKEFNSDPEWILTSRSQFRSILKAMQ
jgi:hypothetical protein